MNTLEKLGQFNVWANETLLRRLDSSVAAGHELPANALRLFSHVLNAQSIWLCRVVNEGCGVKVWQEHDLDGLHVLHERTSARLAALCATTDEAELNRLVEYTNSLGQAYSTPVQDILTHAVVHASYHRGQTATRLREAGIEPVNTDFVTYCREQMGQAEPQL